MSTAEKDKWFLSFFFFLFSFCRWDCDGKLDKNIVSVIDFFDDWFFFLLSLDRRWEKDWNTFIHVTGNNRHNEWVEESERERVVPVDDRWSRDVNLSLTKTIVRGWQSSLSIPLVLFEEQASLLFGNYQRERERDRERESEEKSNKNRASISHYFVSLCEC